MPEEKKLKPSEIQVELDTSGPEVDVTLEETKEETVVDTAPETTEQEVVTEEVKTNEEKKEDDSQLEDYSKGVQSRIAKLTRKMREAERKEAAALEYAAAVENKRKEDQLRFSEKQVDLDTSGPEVDVTLEDTKEEAVVDTAPETTEQETVTEVKETEETKKEDDSKLEEYSKGVQGRIAKLTRKMREAERKEAAAVQYAQAVEKQRQLDLSKLNAVNTEYTTKLEENVTSAMESAQNELRMAIEAQDANLQVTANKKIATLALENANLQMRKKQPVEQGTPVQLSDGGRLPEQTPRALPEADPVAEDWAAKNRWFGQDRAMTFTAFEIHKDLVDKEGIDPKSDEYYTEIDKRIRVDFPHKFGNNETIATTKPVQSVASANRSVKSGRKQVRLTSSQVAIAKKLGVPLEEYAKQLKLTEGA